MIITIDQIKESQDFMCFWNSVYSKDFEKMSEDVKNTIMTVAYCSFIAGMNNQKSVMGYEVNP